MSPRGVAAALGITAVGSALVLYITTRTSSGASATSIFMALGAMVLVWMFLTRRVELALAVAVAYVGLLDGFLRLKTGSSSLTMGRDAFVYAVACGMLVRRGASQRAAWRWPPLTIWIVGWIAFVLVQLLNPGSGPTMHRIVSLRQDLEFIPLFFMAYALVRSRAQLRTGLMLLLVIGAVNGAVGLYQSTLSPAQLAGWGAGYHNLLQGGHGAPATAVGANGQTIVRPPALGGDMGFAGAMGIIALPCGIALLLTRRGKSAEKALLGALLVLATAGVLTSQSRASVISAVVALFAFAGMLAVSREVRKVLVGLAVFGVITGGALSFLSNGSLYRYSSITPSKIAGTVTSTRSSMLVLIPRYASNYPFGAGIGSSGPASGQYGASAHTLNGENQIAFLIAEVGLPGLVLFVAFQIRVLVGSVRRLRKLTDSELRILLAAVIAPLIGFVVNWWVGVNTTSPPNAPYMWGAFGILAFWLFSRHQTVGEPQIGG